MDDTAARDPSSKVVDVRSGNVESGGGGGEEFRVKFILGLIILQKPKSRLLGVFYILELY